MNEGFLSRGKRKDTGEWAYGVYVPDISAILGYFEISGLDTSCDLINCKCVVHKVKRETVGRCTGLTDKNDKRIFEGDFLKAGDFIFVVKFGNCGGVNNVKYEVGYVGFYVIPVGKDAESLINSGLRTDIMYWLNTYSVCVIGNVHDDKQMLSCADMPIPEEVLQPVIQSATPENFEISPA